MDGLSWRRINCTVAGVLCIIVFIYFTVVTCVIIPWLSYSVPGAFNLLCLSFNTLVALVCFLACVLVDPGRVPDDYVPDAETQTAVVEVKRKSGETRFCQKCSKPKPARSHHCRVCKRCVLRMDHHCPWINNCVGHGNYKAFLLFLLYVNAAIIHALGLLAAHAVYSLRMHTEHREHMIRTGPKATAIGALDNASTGTLRARMIWAGLQTICTAITLPLTIGLVMLFIWNLYLVVTNKTTIEYHEGVTARIQAQRSGQEYEHPYDLGLCGNLHTIFGPKPSYWLLPGVPAFGDGVSFVTAWDRHTADGLLGL
ncbi:hypothetical protein WJX72_007243 [[Myrmecia] bisecta]|uniref:S-acyltransferase n=1 Tax=[Myrmecia] bisecta TaxID=41462 RepID=A0AAW1P3E2_9CHLO